MIIVIFSGFLIVVWDPFYASDYAAIMWYARLTYPTGAGYYPDTCFRIFDNYYL